MKPTALKAMDKDDVFYYQYCPKMPQCFNWMADSLQKHIVVKTYEFQMNTNMCSYCAVTDSSLCGHLNCEYGPLKGLLFVKHNMTTLSLNTKVPQISIFIATCITYHISNVNCCMIINSEQ